MKARTSIKMFLVICMISIMGSLNLGIHEAYGDSWVLNSPIWNRTRAEAEVRTALAIDDSGVAFFNKTSATAGH